MWISAAYEKSGKGFKSYWKSVIAAMMAISIPLVPPPTTNPAIGLALLTYKAECIVSKATITQFCIKTNNSKLKCAKHLEQYLSAQLVTAFQYCMEKWIGWLLFPKLSMIIIYTQIYTCTFGKVSQLQCPQSWLPICLWLQPHLLVFPLKPQSHLPIPFRLQPHLWTSVQLLTHFSNLLLEPA